MEVTDTSVFTAPTLSKRSDAELTAITPQVREDEAAEAFAFHPEGDQLEYWTHAKHGRPEEDFAPALLVNPGATVAPLVSAAISRAERVKSMAELLSSADLRDMSSESLRTLFYGLEGMADEVLQLIHAIDHKVAHTTRPIAE